jgi:DNA ligase (NAD+)
LAEVIDKLAAADVNLSEPLEVTEHGQGPLSGKVVVVTGKMTGPFEGLGRTEMNALIEKAGGKAGGSVCAKTSILVAAPSANGSPSSKALKAQELGVEVATPKEFAELVADFL